MTIDQYHVNKSDKLRGVCYDIRGPGLREAHRLEDEGHRVIKLNIGNPAPFGFEAPEELLQDVISNLDRKSTRLNSSHDQISYAVFCLKKNIRQGRRRHQEEYGSTCKVAAARRTDEGQNAGG